MEEGLDANRAENRADELELEASVAIDYAISAVEQAQDGGGGRRDRPPGSA